MPYIRNFAIIIILAMTSSCSWFNHITKYQPSTNQENQQKLLAISEWRIEGALGINYHHKREMARFKWWQNQDSFLINVSGPLNLGAIKITGNNTQVTLTKSGRATKTTTIEQLMQLELGWSMPVSNIRYWILGLPKPGTKVEDKIVNLNNQLTEFTQDNWRVKFNDFNLDHNNRLTIPNKIEIAAPGINLKIKVTKHQLVPKR